MNTQEVAFRQLVDFVAKKAAKADGLIMGVSGTDSFLTYAICAKATPGRVKGFHFGTEDSLPCASWLRERGELEIRSYDRPDMDDDVFRWAMILSESLKTKYWPVSTRNRTENFYGNYSRASEVATILPIVAVSKSGVLELCRFIGVPDEVIQSAYKPDPRCGRCARTVEIGAAKMDGYAEIMALDGLDDYARAQQLAELGMQRGEVEHLKELRRTNAFKRDIPYRGPAVL